MSVIDILVSLGETREEAAMEEYLICREEPLRCDEDDTGIERR